MKYLILIVVVLGSMTASCQTKPSKVKFHKELSTKDSTFVENVLKVDCEDYADAYAEYVEKHITLYVYWEHYTRIYYLSPDGRIETILEFRDDGTFIDYEGESN